MRPQPGDYGVVSIGSGVLPNLARKFSRCIYNHAFVVGEDDMAIEAWPGGVRLRPLADYEDGRPLMYSHEDLTVAQRWRVATFAYRSLGRWYDYLEFGLLALNYVGLRIPPVRSPWSLLCSELVVRSGAAAGLDWSDGHRIATPATLAARALSMSVTISPRLTER